MQVRKTPPAPIGYVPDPAAFRGWIQACLAILGTSASRISRDIGRGRNTVGEFLTTPDRDIAMSTAHGITCRLRELSAEQGVALPRLEGRADG